MKASLSLSFQDQRGLCRPGTNSGFIEAHILVRFTEACLDLQELVVVIISLFLSVCNHVERQQVNCHWYCMNDDMITGVNCKTSGSLSNTAMSLIIWSYLRMAEAFSQPAVSQMEEISNMLPLQNMFVSARQQGPLLCA